MIQEGLSLDRDTIVGGPRYSTCWSSLVVHHPAHELDKKERGGVVLNTARGTRSRNIVETGVVVTDSCWIFMC